MKRCRYCQVVLRHIEGISTTIDLGIEPDAQIIEADAGVIPLPRSQVEGEIPAEYLNWPRDVQGVDLMAIHIERDKSVIRHDADTVCRAGTGIDEFTRGVNPQTGAIPIKDFRRGTRPLADRSCGSRTAGESAEVTAAAGDAEHVTEIVDLMKPEDKAGGIALDALIAVVDYDISEEVHHVSRS